MNMEENVCLTSCRIALSKRVASAYSVTDEMGARPVRVAVDSVPLGIVV